MTETIIDSDAFRAYKVEQNTSLLDLATGPRYVATAARWRGANVVGVDFSESMIEKVRRLYPEIDLRIDDAERRAASSKRTAGASGWRAGPPGWALASPSLCRSVMKRLTKR